MNSMPGYSENESNDKKDSDPLDIAIKNLNESKKKISDSFDCLYYRSSINSSDQKILHILLNTILRKIGVSSKIHLASIS